MVVQRDEIMYDAIVIGGGPSGATAARFLAKFGLNTILIEKKKIPREKICGGGVTEKALKIINRKIPDEIIEREFKGLAFHLGKDHHATFKSIKRLGITVMRSKYDAFLVDLAKDSGAEIKDETRAKSIEIKSDKAIVHLGNGDTIEGKVIIGADGMTGISAYSFTGIKTKDFSRVGIGMEAEFKVGKKGVEKFTDPEILDIYNVGVSIAYGWIFPKREHLGIGVAGLAAQLKNIKEIFYRFVKFLEYERGIELPDVKPKSWMLGGASWDTKIAFERGLLLGDAAGYVDPLMGEGIYYAMHMGIRAAQVTAEAVEADDFSEKFMMRYQERIHRDFKADFKFAEKMGANGNAIFGSIIDRFDNNKLGIKIMEGLATGELTYGNVIAYGVVEGIKMIPTFIKNKIIG